MWSRIKSLLSKSKSLNSLLGDVIYEAHAVQGQTSHSLFQWRVKRTIDGQSILIGLKLLPDGYAGPEGSPTNYISFDLPTAMQIRADLDECIHRAREMS